MSVHFDNSFFKQTPELSFHKPSLTVKEDPFKHHFFAVCGDKLGVVQKGAVLPAGAETDLRKIRSFVLEHFEELGTVPLTPKDAPLDRISQRMLGLDLLIGKHNQHVENSVLIRILSIFLLIVTFGLYNYKDSLLIPHIAIKGEKLASLLDKVDYHLSTKEKLAEKERLLAEQELVEFLQNPGKKKSEEIEQNHPGISDIITAENKKSISREAIRVKEIADKDGRVAFYRSGPTASLSLFAECRNGIHIYGKKFSCIASAFEYKRCETAECSAKELEKFTSLNGDEAFAYGETLTKETAKQNILKAKKWDSGPETDSLQYKAMEEIVLAKYAQNKDMLTILKMTGNAQLLCHAPEGSKDGFWGDQGDGSGRNELGAILEKTRALALGKQPPTSSQSSFKGNPPGYTIF